MKNKTKKIILSVAILPFTTFLVANAAVPQTPSDVLNLVQKVVGWIYTAFFVVAVLYILLAAFKFLRGADNPQNVEEAKKRLLYAVIAIVVALVASGVSVFIEKFITT
jgi:heme O synthase-like polyprenyltransferase